ITYAQPYSQLSSLVPNLSSTTWGNWDPNATATATDTNDPYGQAAWSAQWVSASIALTTGRYSTTVSPTPVPTSELITPPPEYFGPTDCFNFPKDFIFGVAGAAGQCEGAVAMEGKSPSILEKSVTEPSNSYVTNEHYFLYKQDIERLASIGVKYYSFSIPWTRILPFTYPGTPVNQQAIDHYDDLINFVIEKGMAPIITLIHLDTPYVFWNFGTVSQEISDLGAGDGKFGSQEFEDAFVNYGKILMTHFADRVPIWMTYDEPFLQSNNATGVYHIIKSHARIYHFYKDVLKGTGKIGLKLNDNFGVPKDPNNASDVEAANHFNSLQIGIFANPIYLGLDYPDSVKNTLPGFDLNSTDLAYFSGTADFIGVDPYTAVVISSPPGGISACTANETSSLRPYCVTEGSTNIFGWKIGLHSQYDTMYQSPKYLRTYLSYLYNTFHIPVMATDFGFPTHSEADWHLEDQLYDSSRTLYYQSYLTEMLKAIWLDGVDVMGALAWTWADNWEFGSYDHRFGLQTVDRDTMERRYKRSFFDVMDFVGARMGP
ncbi:hypothetical protein HYALB_00001511, partial [Hymenoscyphus albidus]